MVGLYTIDSLPEAITDQVSFGLTSFTSNFRTQNSPLTTDLQIENDNLDFIFTIDNNLKWHDGQKIKTSDIQPNINGIQVKPINKQQLKINLEKPFSPILSVLAKPLFKKGTLGLGQYQIEEYTYQKDFIKSITLSDTQDKKNKKIYIFYDQEEKLINAYKLGEIDTIIDISSPKDLANWPKTKITPVSKLDQSYIAIFLNTQKINQKEIRQALAYATPKNTNKEDRCLSPISPMSWAYNSTVKEYNYSPSRARELFKDKPISTINLVVNNRKLLSLADDIRKAWQDTLAIEVNLAYQNQLNPDFDAVLAFAAIPKDPDQYEFWHSTQNTNITHLNNPKIDKLLEEGRQVFDVQKRKEIYLEFQKNLLEESPAIFLSYPTAYNIEKLK